MDAESDSESARLDSVVRRRLPLVAFIGLSSTVVSGVISFVAAAWLGPSKYGQVQTVLIAYGMASVVQIGFFAGSLREAIHYRSLDDPAQATRSQNIGTTYELLVSVPPAFVVAALALFTDEHVKQIGFVLALLAVPTASLASFLGGLEIGYGNTERATVSAGIGSLVTAALTIAGIKTIGPTALFIAPIIGNLVTILILTPRLAAEGLRPDFSFAPAMEILRTGYPLAANTILFWTYRWVGPITIVLAFGSVTLGFYSLANMPVASVVAILALGGQILLPRFWDQISKGERHRWVKEGDATASFFLLTGCAVALIGQALFPWFVREFLPHYGPSVLFFSILVLEIPLYLGGQTQSMVLDSVVIGRQKLNLALMVVVLSANVVLNVTLVLTHFAATSIAWSDMAVQAAAMVGVFIVARPYQGPFRRRLPDLAPGGLALAVFAVVNIFLIGPTVANPAAATSTSTIVNHSSIAAAAVIVMLVGAVVLARHQARRVPDLDAR